MSNVWTSTMTVALGRTGESRKIDVTQFTDAVLDHVFEYGLRQIVNDAMASGKDDAEKVALADKRIANLIEGTLRASGGKSADPVMKRAGQLAEAAIRANAAFKAWFAKLEGDKEEKVKAREAKVAELVKAELAKEDSAFVAQARIDVEAAKSLGGIEINL